MHAFFIQTKRPDMKKIAVIGGGFRGILATVLMKRAGHRITLIENSKRIGGILRPIPWGEFSLDLGIQLFDNVNGELESVIREICGDNISAMEINYASHYAGRTSDSFAILDLCSDDQQDMAQNLYDLVVANSNRPSHEPTSLGERNLRAFGSRVGSIVNAAAERMLLVPPDQVEPEILSATPFNRVRVVPDELASILKKSPELDDSIAMSRKRLAPSDSVNLYPSHGGMASFCDAAEEYCRQNDVEIRTQAGITGMSQDDAGIVLHFGETEEVFDEIIWTSGINSLGDVLLDKNPLTEFEHKVPMVIYYFKVNAEDAGPYTYVQNHDAALDVFRCSTQGVYSNQITAAGETYVCAESTTPTDDPRWEDPEAHADAIWEQCVGMGAVTGKPLDSIAFKIPATYRVPKKGYRQAESAIQSVAETLPGLNVLDHRAFTRSAMFATMSRLSA
jgi:protoporphyrinogen oxidase